MKRIIHTDEAPAAIGPYSQAIAVGDWVYLSGQIPLDPATQELVGPDFGEQVRRVFHNLDLVCHAAGGSLADMVKLKIYLTDLGRFGTVNELMQEFFDEPYPARAALGVAELPRGAPVEMDGVMWAGT